MAGERDDQLYSWFYPPDVHSAAAEQDKVAIPSVFTARAETPHVLTWRTQVNPLVIISSQESTVTVAVELARQS